jgi:SAM-dependent methyltransferase
MDPLAGSSWSAPSTVAGFAQSPPNHTLVTFAADALGARPHADVLLDIGCGAARNATALAELGWQVIGLDLSRPMLEAAAARLREAGQHDRVRLLLAPMDRLPVERRSVDFIVAHGIWNLARTSAEFRRAVAEAARVARPDAALFVFTFSRRTLPASARPVTGESFVFTQFSGQPQVFLTAGELIDELGAHGFVPDPAVPLTEHNAPRAGTMHAGRVPVIWEGAFRAARPGEAAPD